MKTLIYYPTLSEANEHRYNENTMFGSDWPLEKWVLKLQEEVGELASNLTKGKDRANFEEELADITIVVNLIAFISKTNLDRAVAKKFNSKSEKSGSVVRLYERI